MPPLFTINACKSAGCRNLGLPDSPECVWPDYRRGYPALHCRACGSYPPVFHEGAFGRWASAFSAEYAQAHGYFCADCYVKTWIRYGRKRGAKQRLK
ncbi:cytoplasmic protein, partial [Leptospira borgpetersenii serovar Hardjo-bovis]|nr:cytoplasmic protein [Leptospira borgpetersenii serovar Hardjo-bovis]